jgi:HK97 family phage major capsid protein
MEELLKQLKKAIADLNEAVGTKFSDANPKQADEEKTRLVNDVLSLQNQVKALQETKAIQKMVWGVQGQTPEAGAKILRFNDYLKAVRDHNYELLNSMAKAASGQSEGSAANGGNTVPVEYANQIVALERQSSIVRQIAKIFPMGSLTRKIPRELAKPAVSWVGETTEPTLTKGTTEQITQTAKKLIAIIPFSEELLEDNNVNYDQFIAEVVATEMGREEDKQAFVGDISGVTDPFNGVYFATGVNAVTAAGANPTYDEMVDLAMSIRAPYRGRASFVLSTTALKKVMKLKDDQARPIWANPLDGAPGRLMGIPYRESDQIPDTLGTTRTNGANTAILFGAWDGLWISPRGGYSVDASQSASDSTGKSAFTLDETWYKFRRREDITVANPEAFGKYTIAV